jgi:uncharacterized protein (UPF0303 family)
MTADDDLRQVIAQETELVFEHFDEHVAFDIGAALRERGKRENLKMVVDIRLWDRPLFYSALPGATVDNAEWVQRKSNSVRQLHKSTYRLVLEKTFDERVFPAWRNLDTKLFALAGGGFPIKVKGIGIVGTITVSGLAERDDHGLVVEAIVDHLGLDRSLLFKPLPDVV